MCCQNKDGFKQAKVNQRNNQTINQTNKQTNKQTKQAKANYTYIIKEEKVKLYDF